MLDMITVLVADSETLGHTHTRATATAQTQLIRDAASVKDQGCGGRGWARLFRPTTSYKFITSVDHA